MIAHGFTTNVVVLDDGRIVTGFVAHSTPAEFASLLTYVETLVPATAYGQGP